MGIFTMNLVLVFIAWASSWFSCMGRPWRRICVLHISCSRRPIRQIGEQGGYSLHLDKKGEKLSVKKRTGLQARRAKGGCSEGFSKVAFVNGADEDKNIGGGGFLFSALSCHLRKIFWSRCYSYWLLPSSHSDMEMRRRHITINSSIIALHFRHDLYIPCFQTFMAHIAGIHVRCAAQGER